MARIPSLLTARCFDFMAGLMAPAGVAAIGVTLEHAGRSDSILGLAAMMLLLAAIATVSRAIRTS